MTRSSRLSRRELGLLAALLLIGLCMLAFRAGARDIWDIDEGTHAVTTVQMVTTGDWVTPWFNGDLYYDKPPMMNWLVAISFTMLGQSEFSARLPPVLFGLTLVLLTFLFGRRVFDSDTGFLGGVMLSTSVMYVVMSRVIVHDIFLTLYDSVALFAFYLAYTDPRRIRWLVVQYVAIGLAMLSKGPLGMLLPAAVVLTFLALRRDLGFVRRMMLFRGALLTALVAVPWYAAIAMRDPEFLSYFLMKQNIERFLEPDTRHAQPMWYFLPTLLVGFFPWSCYLPMAFRRGPGCGREKSATDVTRQFLWCWVLFVLVFFSLASSKLPNYILPLFPPAALLIGDLWHRLLGSEGSKPSKERKLGRGLVLAQCFVIGTLVSIAVAGWITAPTEDKFDPEVHRLPLIGVIVILLAGAALSAYFLIRRNRRGMLAATAGGVGLLVLYLAVVLAPVFDAYRSSKEIAREIDDMLPPGQKIVFYRDLQESALYYTGRGARRIRSDRLLMRYLEKDGTLFITDRKGLRDLEPYRNRIRIVSEHADKVIATGK